MNDPMEGEHSESRMFRIISRRRSDFEDVRQHIAQCGIASLSESHLSEPMWAHYAGHFEGICVEYHLGRLTNGLPSDVAIVRMQYSEEAPTLRANRDSTPERARLVLSSKTLRWATEREWRVLSPHEGRLNYRYPKPAVLGVYVGSRMPDDMVREVIRRMHAKDISVHLMLIDKYTIQFSAKVPPTPREQEIRNRRKSRNKSLEDLRGGTVSR